MTERSMIKTSVSPFWKENELRYLWRGGSRVAGWRDWAHFGRDYCGIAGLAEKISGISGLRKNRDRDLAKK